MGNRLYGKAKQGLFSGDIDVLANQLKILFVDSSYSPLLSSDEFVSDVLTTSIKHRSNQLTNVTNTNGVLDADDLAVSDYPGDAFKALVIYQSSGNDATSRLIAYIEDSVGLPFPGTNSTIPLSIVWNNSSTKIIALTDS